MKHLFFIVLVMSVILPVSAGQPVVDSNRSFTLFSVSHPGYAVTEVDSLCLVALPAAIDPLRLKVVRGIGDPKGVSLESADNPGYFLRHQDSRLKLHPYAEDDLYAADSTFYLVTNNDGSVSFRSRNYPKQYICVTASKELYICTDPGLPFRSFFLR
jgi:hypothetical protein